MSQNQNAHLRNLIYRPEIDALRALCVLLVVIFHADLGLSGGFVGVDVFFVISGYLITGIIVRDIEAERFRFGEFWVRRIRRIAPNATFMALTVMVAGMFVLLPADLIDLAKSCMFHQVGLSNMFFWRTSGYFDGQSELKPLLHTWSLAVEEQFYCLLPLALVLLFRYQRRHLTKWLTFGLLASMTLSIYCVQFHASVAFYWLPPRGWELLLGSLISLVMPPRQTWQFGDIRLPSSWICGGSLIAIFLCSSVYSSTTPFPGVMAVFPCVAAGLFLVCDLADSRFLRTLLQARPLLVIGRASYSIYLWHWPILVFLRYRSGLELPVVQRIGAAIAAILTGIFFWSLLEEPVRRRKVLSSNSHLIVAFVTSFVSLVGVGWFLSQDGWRSRFSPEFMSIVDVPYAGLNSGVTGDQHVGWHLPSIGDPDTNDVDFILWGDSYAKCLSPLIHEKAAELRIRGLDAGRGGTPPLLSTWTGTEDRRQVDDFFRAVLKELDRSHAKWLILVAGWDVHASGMSHIRDADGFKDAEAVRSGLQKVIAEANHRGVQIVVFTQPPYQRVSVPSVVARQVMAGAKGPITGIPRIEHQHFQRRSRQVFSNFEKEIKVLDIDSYCFNNNHMSLIGEDSVAYYSDAGHPSDAGVRQFYAHTVEALLQHISEQKHKGRAVSSFQIATPAP